MGPRFFLAAMLLASVAALAFESPEGGFTAAFPDEPKIVDKDTSRGSERWHSLVKDHHSYMVVYYDATSDVAALSTQQLLDAEEDGMAGQNSRSAKRDFKLGGFPAREVQINTPNGLVMLARFVIRKKRVYEVIAVSAGTAPDDRQRAFVASFGLVHAPASTKKKP
jgi:hypothetical protein